MKLTLTEVFIIFIMIGIFASLVVLAKREVRCMEYGYLSAKTSLGGQTYCIKRVNQTDVVVRLDSLEHAR